MLVACSKISISVVAKHVQHTGIIRAFLSVWGLIKFFSAWEDRTNCWVVVC